MRWRSWFTARRKVHFSMCTHIGRCIGIDQSWLRPRLGVRCPKRLRHRSIKLRHRGKPSCEAAQHGLSGRAGERPSFGHSSNAVLLVLLLVSEKQPKLRRKSTKRSSPHQLTSHHSHPADTAYRTTTQSHQLHITLWSHHARALTLPHRIRVHTHLQHSFIPSSLAVCSIRLLPST